MALQSFLALASTVLLAPASLPLVLPAQPRLLRIQAIQAIITSTVTMARPRVSSSWARAPLPSLPATTVLPSAVILAPTTIITARLAPITPWGARVSGRGTMPQIPSMTIRPTLLHPNGTSPRASLPARVLSPWIDPSIGPGIGPKIGPKIGPRALVTVPASSRRVPPPMVSRPTHPPPQPRLVRRPTPFLRPMPSTISLLLLEAVSVSSGMRRGRLLPSSEPIPGLFVSHATRTRAIFRGAGCTSDAAAAVTTAAATLDAPRGDTLPGTPPIVIGLAERAGTLARAAVLRQGRRPFSGATRPTILLGPVPRIALALERSPSGLFLIGSWPVAAASSWRFPRPDWSTSPAPDGP